MYARENVANGTACTYAREKIVTLASGKLGFQGVVFENASESFGPAFTAVFCLRDGKPGAALVAELGQRHAVLVEVKAFMASHACATTSPAHAVRGVVADERGEGAVGLGEGVGRVGA